MKNYYLSAQTIQPDGSLTEKRGTMMAETPGEALATASQVVVPDARITVFILTELPPPDPIADDVIKILRLK